MDKHKSGMNIIISFADKATHMTLQQNMPNFDFWPVYMMMDIENLFTMVPMFPASTTHSDNSECICTYVMKLFNTIFWL